MPVRAPTCSQPYYGYSEKLPHLSRLLQCAWGYGGSILFLNPQGPHGGSSKEAYRITVIYSAPQRVSIC